MYEILFNTRPFDNSKEFPREFTQYSSDTYQSTWQLLLRSQGTPSSRSHTQPLLNLLYSEASLQSNEIPLSLYSLPENTLPHDDNTPLPCSLVIPIPHTTALKQPTSEHCKSFLSSLLDVRIHKRIGVGENYSSFEKHKWFTSCSLPCPSSSSHLKDIPSLLRLDIEMISTFKVQKLIQLNMEDTLARDTPVPKEILEYFQHFDLN